MSHIDLYTGAYLGVDYAHHEIHEGSAFISSYEATLASGAVSLLRIGVGSAPKHAHMMLEIDAGASTDVAVFETTTYTDASGNRVIGYNRHREKANSSLLTICHTPTGSGEGTKIFGMLLGASGGAASGGSGSGRKEFILKPDTAYLIKVTSNAVGNRITIILDWYETSSKEV